jgi:probable F420-dependent oxidoreductase
MKIGTVYPQFEMRGDPGAVARFGTAAEQLGYDHLVVYDHVVASSHDREIKLQGAYTDRDPFHDPFTVFAYLAALTTRIKFLSGVLILPQRQTLLVAKQAADIDLLSGQRLTLGIGIGWNPVEYHALGQDFKKRARRIDEQIGFLRRLWTEPAFSFAGEFDQLDRACINPRPARVIPFWYGGHADPGFRRAAELCDGFVFSKDTEICEQELTRLRWFLQQAGRDEQGFALHWLIRFGQSLADVTDRLKWWQDIGGTHAAVATLGKGFRTIDEHIDFIAEVSAKLALA